MRVEINISTLQYKLLISLVVICLFYVIYSSIPSSEYGRIDKTVNEITTTDRIIYTLERHLMISSRNSIYPITNRSEILGIVHSIVAWCIFVL